MMETQRAIDIIFNMMPEDDEEAEADAGRTRPERPDYQETESAARRIADLEREVKQREQSREHSSLKERLEENKRIIAERERENARCRNHDRGMSR